MKMIKKAKRKPTQVRDPKKEIIFRLLARQLEGQGFDVRRELLRQGHGWKVSSGSCSADGKRYLFVDRRLTQDEQISFLLNQINDMNIEMPEAVLEQLPDPVRHCLQAAA